MVEQIISETTKEVGPAISNSAVAPTTTVEENLHTASQRRVNIIWEITQASIAVAITLAKIYTSIVVVNNPSGSETLSNAFFLIVGFYFGRTNHQMIGGVQLGR